MDKLKNVKLKIQTIYITTISLSHSVLKDMNWIRGKIPIKIKNIFTVAQYAHILSIMIPQALLNARPALKDASIVQVDQKTIVLHALMAMIWPKKANVKYMTIPKKNWNAWTMVRNGMIIGMAASVYPKTLLMPIIINQE